MHGGTLGASGDLDLRVIRGQRAGTHEPPIAYDTGGRPYCSACGDSGSGPCAYHDTLRQRPDEGDHEPDAHPATCVCEGTGYRLRERFAGIRTGDSVQVMDEDGQFMRVEVTGLTPPSAATVTLVITVPCRDIEIKE